MHAILQLSSNVDALHRDPQLRGQFRVLDLVPRENVQGSLVISRLVADSSASRIEQALRAMREDGTVKTIMERHTSPERALAMAVR